MPEKLLIPSIEQRLSGLVEVSRRSQQMSGSKGKGAAKPAITISREFGCEAYPVAERLKLRLEEKSGEQWALVDKALLDEVAKDHDLARNVLHSLGDKPRWLDEMLSTLTPRWKNEKDYYKLLCEQIVSIAKGGNVIIVGMGGAIVTQALENCCHFRIFASEEFKIRSIARRMKITPQDAAILIEQRQTKRDKFIRNFLNEDARDLRFYHLIFNNDRNTAEQVAAVISAYVLEKK